MEISCWSLLIYTGCEWPARQFGEGMPFHTNYQMANIKPEPGIPLPSDDTTEEQFPLEFIDELELKRNPVSHLRTVIRSNAKKASFLRRRSLTAVNTRLLHLRPRRSLETVIDFKKEIHETSVSGSLGNVTAPKEDISLAMPIREDCIR